MAKDPAFLFYPNDWIGGTMGMTFEEKGAYMELLMMQFNRGHMTSHMIGQTVGQLWVKIQDKFIQDEKGLWFNERLELEKIKRKNFTKSRRNNLSGNNQYSKKQKKDSGHMDGHMTSHMENENVNEIEDVEKGVPGGKTNHAQFPKLETPCELSELEKKLTAEFLKLTCKIDWSHSELQEMFEGFKIQNFTGQKFYEDHGAIVTHFRNWMKTQKKQVNGKQHEEPGSKSRAKIAALKNW